MAVKDTVKKWWRSKTIWVNIVALIALVLQYHYGFIIAPGEQAGIIIVVNLLLRGITHKGLEIE